MFKMNEAEIVMQRMENEKAGGGFEKSEQQIALEAAESDRK
jgi:hypothetical protein